MKQEHLEKIESYIQSKITLEELKIYANNEGIENLEENIEWIKNVTLAIEADELKKQLKQILPVVKKQEPKIRRLSSIKMITGIAASLAFFVLAYWGIQNNNNSNNLYAQYEYKDLGLPVTMSQSKNYKLYDALTYFGEENYTTCIEKLQSINKPHSDTVSYYLGASQYYNKNYDQAILNLKNSIDISHNFKEEAQWLIVLSSLKLNKKEKALVILNEITTKSIHKFREQANELKSEINN